MKVYRVSKFILIRTMLSLDKRLYCLVKKLLNRFAFSKISVTRLLFTSSGNLIVIYSVFEIVLYVLGAVLFKFICGGFLVLQFGRELIWFDVSSIRTFKDVYSVLADFLDQMSMIKGLLFSFLGQIWYRKRLIVSD